MKNKIVAGSILVIAGVGFLIAGQQFAQPAHAAPSGAITEAVFVIPSLIFSVVGSMMLVVAVIMAACVLFESKE